MRGASFPAIVPQRPPITGNHRDKNCDEEKHEQGKEYLRKGSKEKASSLAGYGVLRGRREVWPGLYRQGQSDAVRRAAAAVAGGEVGASQPGVVSLPARDAVSISKNDLRCLVFDAGNDAALVSAVSACYKSVAVERP